jgi:hypothetical protein
MTVGGAHEAVHVLRTNLAHRATSFIAIFYGKIFFPMLHNVGWTDASGKPLSSTELLDDDLPDDVKGKAA